MDQLKQYIEENKQRFLDELFELIRVPSISAIPENKPDMIKMAGLLLLPIDPLNFFVKNSSK